MKLAGFEYRFEYFEDPPCPYGVGVGDPDNEFWVVPRYKDKPPVVYRRPRLPVDKEQSNLNEWFPCQVSHLIMLGEILGGSD